MELEMAPDKFMFVLQDGSESNLVERLDDGCYYTTNVDKLSSVEDFEKYYACVN